MEPEPTAEERLKARPLSERLTSPLLRVALSAEIELRDRVINLLVGAGHVQREKVDEAFELARSLK